ncbi:MAG: SRPBCC family protein [Anaerolineae bacterium]|nr:SRPBCC family protein [Anaerolineae bacterium]
MTKTNLIAEPGKQEIRMERIFDAPRDLVFQVWTDPKHIPQWWGPSNLTTIVALMDAKAGGLWRFIQRDQQGNEFAFHGVYHDIVSPERIVNTFEFEGTPGHVVLETATFEALPDGKTKVIASSVFQSLADRDGMIQSGMESGAAETWERFAELLGTLQTAVR